MLNPEWIRRPAHNFQTLKTDIEYPRNSSADNIHRAEDTCCQMDAQLK